MLSVFLVADLAMNSCLVIFLLKSLMYGSRLFFSSYCLFIRFPYCIISISQLHDGACSLTHLLAYREQKQSSFNSKENNDSTEIFENGSFAFHDAIIVCYYLSPTTDFHICFIIHFGDVTLLMLCQSLILMLIWKPMTSSRAQMCFPFFCISGVLDKAQCILYINSVFIQ